MPLPGVEKKIDVTFLLNERDIRTASRFVAEKGYRIVGVKRISGPEMEIAAYFGAVDIFDAMDQLEDDDLYENVTSLKINGFLNTAKKVAGVSS